MTETKQYHRWEATIAEKTDKSTRIHGYEYEPNTKTLTIEFKRGDLYNYYKVDQYLVEQLYEAESKGTYFGQYIEKFYEYERVL